MRIEWKEALCNCKLVVNRNGGFGAETLVAMGDFAKEQRTKIKTLVLYSNEVRGGYSYFVELLAEANFERIVLIGKAWNGLTLDLFGEVFRFESATSFGQYAWELIPKHSTIALIGHNDKEFDAVEGCLAYCTQISYVEVNLDAIAYNLEVFRTKLRPGTKTLCMLKAFGYGNGSGTVANTLAANKVDYFGVGTVDEGAELRREGILTSIMVLMPSVPNFEKMLRLNLEAVVFSVDFMDKLSRFTQRRAVGSVPIHLKFDTGMHRMGIEPAQIDDVAKLLQTSPQFRLVSMMTHLAGSDEAEFDGFTVEQANVFEDMCGQMISLASISYPVMRHILNTHGVSRFPQYQYEMVRIGLGIYGGSTDIQDELQIVSSFSTEIIQIKHVASGQTVGYSRRGNIDAYSRIAVLPVGYADGISRKLSGGVGKVWINGKLAPIVGNVSMNIISIDITNIDAKLGDRAYFFAPEYPIDKLAEQLGTIPYEIITAITDRIPRVYFILKKD